MDNEKKEYSIAREIVIVFLTGLILGLTFLVAGLGLVEFLKS
jgi:hypothetical protein|tara:strand:+ start:762 stop:887 length:126 start_codon:yes stop_codon:yes gene_type:complete